MHLAKVHFKLSRTSTERFAVVGGASVVRKDVLVHPFIIVCLFQCILQPKTDERCCERGCRGGARGRCSKNATIAAAPDLNPHWQLTISEPLCTCSVHLAVAFFLVTFERQWRHYWGCKRKTVLCYAALVPRSPGSIAGCSWPVRVQGNSGRCKPPFW